MFAVHFGDPAVCADQQLAKVSPVRDKQFAVTASRKILEGNVELVRFFHGLLCGDLFWDTTTCWKSFRINI